MTPGDQLRELLRSGDVFTVLGVPYARAGQIMDRCGVQVGFVGTSITVGNYIGIPDTGVASATESLLIGGWIARSVHFPVILDGDTGHGGVAAVRRLVHEAIREGLAGIRLDDQPLEFKRSTQSEGILVVDRAAAVERYRAAVEAKNEVDPSFVVMAQCYARDAVNGGLDELLHRLPSYENEGGVDWVQFEAPHSIDEIRSARASTSGPLSAMQGSLKRPLTAEECKTLGLAALWYTFLPHRVQLYETARFLDDFNREGLAAWDRFMDSHIDKSTTTWPEIT